MQERQRVRQRIHFASEETEDKLLHGLLERGSTENGLDQILNVFEEVVQGSVESGGGGVDPTEDPVVDGVLNAVHLGVDLVNVHRGLVQHVCAHGCGNRVRKVVRGRECLVPVGLCDGTEGEKLNLNRQKTDKADEEARKDGGVEYVAEEPSDVNVLGG